MKVGLFCCWSSMRIYPIYSFHLQKSLENLIGRKVPVVTTNCMCFHRDDPVNDEYEFLNIPYFNRNAPRPRIKHVLKEGMYSAAEFSRGRAFARRARDFDIVDFQQSSYAFGFESLESFLSGESKAKRVVTIHKLDAAQKEKPELNRVYNKADKVIVFSNHVKRSLINDGVRPSKVAVVYHGTSLPPVAETQRDQAILFCGSPIPTVKGFEHYVVALRLLREGGIDLKTKIYGFFRDDEKEYAVWLASEEGVEDLLSWQTFKSEDELVAEYQKSLLCVIPYTGYGGYFPAAHAMGNAVPIVATDILGHSEYVESSGLLVPPAAPDELASAMRRVLEDEDLRRELGASGRKWAEEALNWDFVAARTLYVFEAVLAG